MILMMINGVYGGGAFVFFLFALLYNQLGISMKALFIGYFPLVPPPPITPYSLLTLNYNFKKKLII